MNILRETTLRPLPLIILHLILLAWKPEEKEVLKQKHSHSRHNFSFRVFPSFSEIKKKLKSFFSLFLCSFIAIFLFLFAPVTIFHKLWVLWDQINVYREDFSSSLFFSCMKNYIWEEVFWVLRNVFLGNFFNDWEWKEISNELSAIFRNW